jgi:NAD(P)-dependent dehydrogenase (short-subunit alcohol dehydrogenase family)
MTLRPLFIGTDTTRPVADQLGAEFVPVPDLTLDPAWSNGSEIDVWRAKTAAGTPAKELVVAVSLAAPEHVAVVDQDLDRWIETMETPFALWFAALAAATERCADHGQVLALVDRPDSKEAAGWGAEASVADAVEIMVRSLALVHGGRGVRVNVISTPDRLKGGAAAYEDMTDAIIMLLGSAVGSLSAAVIHLGGEL